MCGSLQTVMKPLLHCDEEPQCAQTSVITTANHHSTFPDLFAG